MIFIDGILIFYETLKSDEFKIFNVYFKMLLTYSIRNMLHFNHNFDLFIELIENKLLADHFSVQRDKNKYLFNSTFVLQYIV